MFRRCSDSTVAKHQHLNSLALIFDFAAGGGTSWYNDFESPNQNIL